MNKEPNKLINEKSPYLQQHAYNPVDWHPWNLKTLEKAKEQNKPIFLSIGYSTCHWCHVMENESFEDENVAKLLNFGFIPIKVDREERPDIDAMYMDVCMMMTGKGGWPLNVFLTPDKKPFFAATYIPKENLYGRAGLKELLLQIIDLWNNNPEELVESSDKAMNAILSTTLNINSSEKVMYEVITRAYEILRASYDKLNAGFGTKPKFPSAHNLDFLLQIGSSNKFTHSTQMAINTLIKIRNGGIYDHLGSGFHRYSTDEKWILPHFEKMLYDQALLISAYTSAFQITGNEIFKNTVYKCIEFIKNEMLDKCGGFCSALDADTSGKEGEFYVWEKKEIYDSLPEKDAELFCGIFNISEIGNFLDEATGQESGKNVLYLSGDLSKTAPQFNMTEQQLENKINEIKAILFSKRQSRVAPFCDDKILTDWNGLMIYSLSRAGFVFKDNEFINLAKKCADFFIEHGITKDGTLYHRYKDGEWAINGFLDDYSFLIYGFCILYQSTFDVKYLSFALQLTETMLKHFEDKENAGFYLSAHYNNELPVNKKEYFDGAYPSGNAMAANSLFLLSRLCGLTEYEEIALNTVYSAGKIINQRPAGFTKTLSLLHMLNSGFIEIVVVSDNNSYDENIFINKLREMYLPAKCVIFKCPENSIQLEQLAPFTKDMKTDNGKDTCFICKNNTCKQPVTTLEDLINVLGK